MSRYTILGFLFLGIGAVPFDTESRYSSCFLDRIKGTVYDFSSNYLFTECYVQFTGEPLKASSDKEYARYLF